MDRDSAGEVVAFINTYSHCSILAKI